MPRSLKILSTVVFLVIVLFVYVFAIAGCGTETEEVVEEEAVEEEAVEEEEWPDRPLTFSLGFGTGGGGDMAVRTLVPFLQEELGVPIVVANRPGAGAIIATETHLFDDPADMNFFMQVSQPYLTVGSFDGDFSADDFVYFSKLRSAPQGIWVRNDSPFSTLEDLLTALQEGEELVTSYIPGGFMELGSILIQELAGVELRALPYDSSEPIRTGLIAGRIDYISSEIHGTQTHIGEDARLLCVFADERNVFFPDVPTANEELEKMGIDYRFPAIGNYFAWMVNKEAKENYPERYEILAEAFTNALLNPDCIALFAEQEVYLEYRTPEETTADIMALDELIKQYKDYFVN